MTPRAVTFLRRLPGCSLPVLIEADNGYRYVVKFRNSPQGPNLLFNEMIGWEIFKAAGLLIAPSLPILITDAFIDHNPECWLAVGTDPVRPMSGLSFGSLFISWPYENEPLQILTRNRYDQVHNRKQFWLAWTIEVLAASKDRRQVVFFRGHRNSYAAIFIDFGEMLGGYMAEYRSMLRSCRYPDVKIYPAMTTDDFVQQRKIIGDINLDSLWKKANRLPAEWITGSAFKLLARCLDILGSNDIVELVQEVAASYVEANGGVDTRCGRDLLGANPRTSQMCSAGREEWLNSLLYYNLPVGVREATEKRRQADLHGGPAA